jgi:hypothetical protein
MVTATLATEKILLGEWKGLVKHFTWTFFSSFLDLFDGLHTRVINSCRTIRQNCKGMPGDFAYKDIIFSPVGMISIEYLDYSSILRFQNGLPKHLCDFS